MIPHDKMQRIAGCVGNTEHSYSAYWKSTQTAGRDIALGKMVVIRAV
jgi:hypothetical protein